MSVATCLAALDREPNQRQALGSAGRECLEAGEKRTLVVDGDVDGESRLDGDEAGQEGGHPVGEDHVKTSGRWRASETRGGEESEKW